jgi:carboxypeptidase family protein
LDEVKGKKGEIMNQLKNERWGIVRVFLMGLLLLANSNFALAQVSSASLVGKVEDASGAAVPEAAVTVTNQETGVIRTATGDATGNYRILSLPVGLYQVKAEKAGFKAAVQTGINLVVGQQGVVNLKLEVGEVQQQVTVTGEVPLVNTTTASVEGLVGEKAVKELPLNGRSFDNLITLNAGAIAVKGMTGGPGNGTQQGNLFSVSGRRFDENLFLINGVEYVGPSQFHSVPGGASGQMLGIDAVREFNVVSDTYGAEYGKRAGAQVSIVTQSGGNQFHGTLFEFLRNSKLDARNFFDQGSIPPFKRNNFGGAAGGPIQKDKTFVFGNYEGFRQRLGLSILMVVPDDNARKGLLPNAQGVPTPVPNLDPRMLPFMAFWPLANGRNLGGGAALSFSNPLQSLREDFGTTRVDHTFSDKDQLATVYTISDGEDHSPQNPIFGRFVTNRMQVVSLQETHLFSPTVVNTFTAGFGRSGFNFVTPPLDPSFPASLSYVQGKQPGRLTLGGGGTGAGSSSFSRTGSSLTNPFITFRNQFSYQDQVQIVKGKHQISTGFWLGRLRSNEFGTTRNTGEAVFASATTFLQGTVQTFRVATGAAAMSWRQWEGAWFLQDNIQLRPNLTVRVGLRHEFDDGFNSANHRATYFDADANGVLITQPVVGDSVYKENNQKKMFSPRVGIAWDPFGKGKTSIRAGFGIYYDMLDTLGFNLNSNPPFGGVAQFTNTPFFSLVPFNPSAPVPPACGPGAPANCILFSPAGVQPTAKTPSANSWTFTVEQGITPSTSLRLGYVGSEGFHQMINADFNSIPEQVCANAAGCVSGGVGSARGSVPQGAKYVPVGTRPNPFISNASQVVMYGQSSYNALMAEFLQRFKAGLQFRANYTWSKTLDTASGNNASDALNNANGILNSYNPRLDWGLSANHLTHKFTFSGGYELPFGQGKHWMSGATGFGSKMTSGWQVNWIFNATSGFPFSLLTGSNNSGNGFTNNPDRPSWNPNFTGKKILGTPDQWFDPHAFSLPVPGTYGNTPRGALFGPNLRELDLSVFKVTKITERVSLQFRAESFNLLNRANFGVPNITPFSGAAFNPSAGVVTNTIGTSRQIQFGLKLSF